MSFTHRRSSTTTLPFSTLSDYVTFSSRIKIPALGLGLHCEEGLRLTVSLVASLAIPEGRVGKGALQVPQPDSAEAQASWQRIGRLPHQLLYNLGLLVMPVRN